MKKPFGCLWLLLALSFGVSYSSKSGEGTANATIHLADSEVFHHNASLLSHDAGIHVASWRYEHVKIPLIVTCFILLVAILKVAFHHLKRVSEVIPESCMLILLGLVLGLIFLAAAPKDLRFLQFDPDFFFLALLPPIILEAAYSLKDRAFIENIGTIMLYAVFGTIMNTVLIGLGIYVLKLWGALGELADLKLTDCLIFSSLIAAVDPVAVLAIFEEVGVNKMLYYMVFGESLLNDAVTVVLYNLMVAFKQMPIVYASDVGLGFAAFLCVSFGAMFIGLVCGLFSALITKFTSKIRVVEPTVMFGMAYLSYLVAELFHFSGIISIIMCGLNQMQYAAENISSKSYITVHYFSKVASSVSESMIFIVLGVMLVQDTSIWKDWHTGFSLYALALCVIVRYGVVFFITYIVNRAETGIRKISLSEQCIIGYGGLRGAVCFSLVFMLDKNLVPQKDTLMTATLIIILFTVFVQGSTIKPLVRLLSIKLKTTDSSLIKEINRGMVNNIMAGVEEIIGHHGTHYWKAMSEHLSQHFLRPAIQKHPSKKGIGLVATYQELALQSELKRSHSNASECPNSEFLSNELQVIDDSHLSHSYSATMLDAYDENKSAVRKRTTFNERPQTNAPQPTLIHVSSLNTLRSLLNKPLHMTKHYKAGDRNLSDDSEDNETHHLNHMTRIRQLIRRHGKKPKDMRRALMPTIATAARLNTLLEESEDPTEDIELAPRSNSDPAQPRPKFSLDIPTVVIHPESDSSDDEQDVLIVGKPHV